MYVCQGSQATINTQEFESSALPKLLHPQILRKAAESPHIHSTLPERQRLVQSQKQRPLLAQTRAGGALHSHAMPPAIIIIFFFITLCHSIPASRASALIPAAAALPSRTSGALRQSHHTRGLRGSGLDPTAGRQQTPYTLGTQHPTNRKCTPHRSRLKSTYQHLKQTPPEDTP